jgi:hypothetical protein
MPKNRCATASGTGVVTVPESAEQAQTCHCVREAGGQHNLSRDQSNQR